MCDSHPFAKAHAVSDLIVLHEQSCFEATENRQMLKMLRGKNASLNAEVDALKGYIESGKVEDMVDGEGGSKNRRREMRVRGHAAVVCCMLLYLLPSLPPLPHRVCEPC